MPNYELSANGQALVSAAKGASVADTSFYQNIIDQISASQNFTNDEKIALYQVIKQEGGNIRGVESQAKSIAERLLTNVLTSDFSAYDFPPQITPTVDDTFRLKVMLVVKAILAATISAQITALQGAQTLLANTPDNQLLDVLRVDVSLPEGL